MATLGMRRMMTAEIMDSLELDAAEHRRALAGLRRLNWASGAARKFVSPLRKLIQQRGLKNLTVLDVACGGGDVPVEVAKAVGSVQLILLDRSPVAVKQAARAAADSEVNYRVVLGDVLARFGERGDVVTNSLFLHHLSETQVVAALRNMREAAKFGVIVSDLRRSWAGYWLAQLACRVLSRSRVVHYDGPVSVRAAWTPSELLAMAERAGMAGAKVVKVFPCRMLLLYFKGVSDE